MIDFLNLGNEEKSTLAGSEFHTFTILSVKKLRRVGLSHLISFVYKLYNNARESCGLRAPKLHLAPKSDGVFDF